MAENQIFGNDDSTDTTPKQQEKQTDNSEFAGRYRISPLTLAVFKRTNDSGEFYNFQLQRTYVNDPEKENPGDGDFDYTDSMRPRDLRKAARLFQKAADDIQELEFSPADDQ